MSAPAIRLERTLLAVAGLIFAAQALGAGAPRPALPPAAAATAAERQLLLIEQGARARADELARQMRGLPEGPARRELQARAEQIKLDGLAQVLTGQAQLARSRGDEAHAQAAERALDLLLHPGHAAPRPAAAVPAKPAPREGGAR